MQASIEETLAELEREGVLTPEQRAIVAERLAQADVRSEDRTAGDRKRLDRPDRTGRFVAIIAGLGGVSLGVGFLSLIAFNWEALGKGAKLAWIFSIWLGFHAAGFVLAEPGGGGSLARLRGRSPGIGRALTTVGVLCFGAAIGLVAQIYHLTSEYPHAILAWWLLNVPIVLWARSRAIQILVTGLFLLWAFWHTGVLVDERWSEHGIGVLAALSLLALGLAAMFAGLAAVSAGTRHARFAGPWRAFAPALACIGVYALSFREPWDDQRLNTGLDPLVFAPFAVAAAAALLAYAIAYRRRPNRARTIEFAAILGAALILMSALATRHSILPFLANAMLLGGIVGWIAHGVARRRPGEINFALAIFALLVITRYVEYFWDRLEGAYAFLVTGALLLGLCWALERRRRMWIAQSLGRTA